ncbi:MAG: histidine phosphatase family protein [Pseudomonadota bacterium]
MNRCFLAGVGALILVVLTVVPQAAIAETPAISPLWGKPGVHAIMRHALAPGTSDPSSFALNECSTQRNLDDRGRAQAASIGKALNEAGLSFDRVLTSQWCRCRETANLLNLGAPDDLPALNSFFQDRSTRDAQTEDVRAFLTSLGNDERVMLVTHQVNITALTGRGVSSGEVFFIRVNEEGDVDVLGEWLLRP